MKHKLIIFVIMSYIQVAQFLQQFCGINAVFSYAVTIFEVMRIGMMMMRRRRGRIMKVVREGWLYKKLSKSWHCQDWLDPPPPLLPQSWHSGGFDDKSA